MILIDLGAQALDTLVPLSLAAGVLAAGLFLRLSDREALRIAMNRIVAHVLELRLFLDEPLLIFRAQRDLLAANLRLLRVVLVPMIVLALPFSWLLAWMDSLYGWAALPIGQATVVDVIVRRPAPSLAGIHLQAAPGFTVETPAVRSRAAARVSWRIRCNADARGELAVVTAAGDLSKHLVCGTGIHRVVATRFRSWLRFAVLPGEIPFRSTLVESIHIHYPPGKVLGLHWLIWFLAASTAGAVVGLKLL